MIELFQKSSEAHGKDSEDVFFWYRYSSVSNEVFQSGNPYEWSDQWCDSGELYGFWNQKDLAKQRKGMPDPLLPG